ncbi:MAG: MMPL family transporter, partial [Asgard group archaeon]|nr:MMPL family transporter [Asgard group archaeon]
TYNFVNTTLFTEFNSSQNMTYPTYETIILPYLDLYMANWTETFYDNITVYDNQIINGTAFSENQFENISLSLAHSSQEDVWNILMNINSTAASNINFTQIIIKNATDFLDVSSFYSEYIDLIGLNPAEVEEAIQPLISVFIANIYTLGPEPTQQAIENVVNEFIEQLIDLINTFYCPPSSIDEVPNLFTRFVLSPDKRTSLILIQYNSFNKTIDEKEQMVKTIDQEIGELAHSLAEEMGLNQTRIYHTGDEYVFEVWVTQAQEDAKLIDIFTIVFVLIILLVIFCSLIEPLIPLAVIGGSISISMALIYFISFAMDIHFLSTLFLTVTSLGAGVDYCIFLLARYNEERKKGKDKFEAVEISTKYAGESVFHSSLTVMVGFGALIIPNFPLLRILGISMIIGIFISIISANLIVPSILLVLGDIIWWPEILQIILRPQKWFKRKKQDDKDKQEGKKARPDGQPIEKTRNDKKNNEKADEKSFLIKFSHFVTNNGLIITLATLLVASPFVYFMFNMETSTDIMGMLSKDFEGTEGRDILSAQLSIGDPTPIKILFTDLEEHPMENNVLKDTLFLSDYIKRQNNDDQRGHNAEVTTVLTTVQPLGLPLAYENPQSRTFFEEQMLRFIGNNNRSFIVEIYLDKDPFDSNTLVFLENLPDLIENSITKANLTTLQSSEIHYLGIAQNLYEIKNVTDTAYPIVISVVIVGVYLVLFFLFGSYFTPIRLIFTIALSIAFTLGLLQLVFSVGFNVPIFWLLPLMLFSILMGLGLDYDIFLVTRIKEYHDKGLSNKTAIAHALDHTATIITSCGILMAAAYSTLFLSNLWHLRELGFAFALAIILDATVVRIIIVPAMMVLLEKYNWVGPKWLQRFGNQNQEHPEKKINSKEKKQT